MRACAVAALLAAAVPATRGLVVVAPARQPLRPLSAAPRWRMQAVDAPVKIPDNVPQLAPTEPKGDKQNQKGKKYKLLLFNDNVNRCAARRLHSACARGSR